MSKADKDISKMTYLEICERMAAISRKGKPTPTEWYVLLAEKKRRDEAQDAKHAAEVEEFNRKRWEDAEKARHAEMNAKMFDRCNGKLYASDEFNVLK